MDKSKFAVAGAIVIFAFECLGAWQSHQSYLVSRSAVDNSQTELRKAQNKAQTMVKGVSKGVIYLHPTGATQAQDATGKYLQQILDKTFTFKDLKQFKENATWVKPKVTGDFYSYWFKGGIEANYRALSDQAAGRSIKRFTKINQLTRIDNTHYFAIIATGIAIDNTNEDTIDPVLFGLDITKQGNKWNFARIRNFDDYANPTPYSNADNDPGNFGNPNNSNKQV